MHSIFARTPKRSNLRHACQSNGERDIRSRARKPPSFWEGRAGPLLSKRDDFVTVGLVDESSNRCSTVQQSRSFRFQDIVEISVAIETILFTGLVARKRATLRICHARLFVSKKSSWRRKEIRFEISSFYGGNKYFMWNEL